MRDLDIYQNLRGEICVCGEAKRIGNSFCLPDYRRLPKTLQQALYRSEGYPVTFRACAATLGIELPTDLEVAQ